MIKIVSLFVLMVVSFGITADSKSITPTGTVFHYSKSNIDGSREANIAVFYRDDYEIESFKWRTGNNAATVVRAEIDPKTLNVILFEAYRLRADGSKIPGVTMNKSNDKEVTVTIAGETQQFNVEGLNWHSYDFDFASLAFAYHYLDNKQAGLNFDIVDFDMGQDIPQLKVFGKVSMKYAGKTTRNGESLLEFNIDGPGLDNRGGKIWFNEKTHEMDGLKIAKPDESSYSSNLMKLLKKIALTEKQWQEFKARQLKPGSD